MSLAARIPSTSSSPRVRSRRDRTRQRILQVSTRLFHEKGFDKVSVEDILSGADLARSSFYRFFANRSEVLAGVIRPVFEMGVRELDSIPAGTPGQVMDSIFRLYLKLWDADSQRLQLATRMGGPYFELFRDVHNAFREVLYRRVAEVESSGILLNANAADTARLIARCAVPVMEVYAQDPRFPDLFLTSMRGLLLRDPTQQTAAEGAM